MLPPHPDRTPGLSLADASAFGRVRSGTYQSPARHPVFTLAGDQRVYKRGALALHALRLRIGDERFFGLLRAWTMQHRHGSVTTGQFTALAEVHAGADLSPFVSEWLYTQRLPALPG